MGDGLSAASADAERRFALDTSCLVALVCAWHEHHAPTLAAVEQRLDAGKSLALAAPALVETYAVLTRLPAPHRLSPADALVLLAENFERRWQAVALSADEVWALLHAAPASKLYGGRTYDAVIAACARKANAHELLTLNLKHFETLGDSSLLIASPL